MNTYSMFNIAFVAFAGVVCLLSRSPAVRVKAALQVAAIVTLLAYPWDFFAVQLGAWGYTASGPRFFGVPINDLVFIFAGSLLSTVLLTHPRIMTLAGREQQKTRSREPR